MKKFICLIAVVSSLLSFNFIKSQKDCDEVKSDADDAYDYLKKAYEEEDLSDAKDYLRQALDAVDDAESAAGDDECDCDDAASAASDTYDYAHKAYTADKLSDLHYYAKQGMDATDDITSLAEDCEDDDQLNENRNVRSVVQEHFELKDSL